jgi:hypothetical protein
MRDTIDMAREAGFELDCTSLEWHKRIKAFEALVRADEREACAKVCDDRAFQFFSESPFFVEMHGLADAIRARENHD